MHSIIPPSPPSCGVSMSDPSFDWDCNPEPLFSLTWFGIEESVNLCWLHMKVGKVIVLFRAFKQFWQNAPYGGTNMSYRSRNATKSSRSKSTASINEPQWKTTINSFAYMLPPWAAWWSTPLPPRSSACTSAPCSSRHCSTTRFARLQA